MLNNNKKILLNNNKYLCLSQVALLVKSKIEMMTSNQQSNEVVIKGNKLKCCVCQSDQFTFRETLMNTPAMTFFKLDWANKKAQNYICNHCGFVHWFMNN